MARSTFFTFTSGPSPCGVAPTSTSAQAAPVRERETLGDRAAHRQPYEDGIVETQLVEQQHEVVHERVDRVAACARACRAAVPGQIGHHQSVVVRERVHLLAPELAGRGEAVAKDERRAVARHAHVHVSD